MVEMCLKIVYSAVFMVVFCCVGSVPEVLIEESSSIEALHAPTGGAVELFCDVTPSLPNDRMGLVIWYKQGHDTPIYSFDIREGVTSHWSDPSTLGARATFRADTTPAVLVLTRLRPDDSGQYRCRVDFIKSPTKNTRLNLTVLIPPDRLLVLNQDGDELRSGVLGPYDEGTPVNLTCVAVGGHPAPRVSWWKAHALLANSEARATVAFTLQRADHGTELNCQAVTDPSIPPISEIITIDVNLRLLWLRLLGGARPLVAGRRAELVCQAVGARPKPNISWWKGGVRLKSARETTSVDGNVTSSVLTLVPEPADAGRVVSCRAGQRAPLPTHEDGWPMDIQHVPVVSLQLGANLNASKVVQGSDVYLDCRVKANPTHSHVYFTHNGVPVKPNPGVLLANQSLVLQRVSRKAAGDYVCIAKNNLGEGSSEKLKLDVKYSPHCQNSQLTILRVAKGEVVEIDCDVDANPKELMTYEWWFNSSSHSKHPLFSATSNIPHRNKLRNNVYWVNSSADYGWIQCSASNSVGQQETPCLFQIQPGEKPLPVKGCEIANMTHASLSVRCTPGRDGGLRQSFLLQIVDLLMGSLLRNVTNDDPEFHVSGLPVGNSLTVSVTAFNDKGASAPVTLNTNLITFPQTPTGSVPVKVELSTMLPLVAGGVVAAVALAAMAAAIVCCTWRCQPTRQTKKDNNKKDETSGMPLTDKKEGESFDSSDKNPDIIPLGTTDSCSNKSTTTDYSTRPLISNSSSKHYDIPSNCERFYDQNIDCNQYIQVHPMEYRVRPTYQPLPNLGPSIQSIGPVASIGLTNVGGDECHGQTDAYFEDWLKYRNALSLNTSGLLPAELMCPEVYPPPQLYSKPRSINLSHMPDVEQRYHMEPRPLINSRSSSNSPPVRFQDNGVHFNRSMADNTNSSPKSYRHCSACLKLKLRSIPCSCQYMYTPNEFNLKRPSIDKYISLMSVLRCRFLKSKKRKT